MEPEEKEWLAQYRLGHVEALGKLVEYHRRPLYGFILKMTESRGDADEIFQETWLRAIKHMHRYRDKNFRSWLFRIAHNFVIDTARKAKPMVDLHGTDTEGQDPPEERMRAQGIGPAEEAAGRDIGAHIRAAVSRLPAEQREVFLMRTDGHLPFKEIARIQGTSINTALARMQYALGKLRELLQGDYESRARDGR